MDEQDIELAADVCCELEGVFVRTLVEIGFLDENDGMFVLHDWEEPHPPSPMKTCPRRSAMPGGSEF